MRANQMTTNSIRRSDTRPMGGRVKPGHDDF